MVPNVQIAYALTFDLIKGQKISKAIFLQNNELKNSVLASKMVRIKKCTLSYWLGTIHVLRNQDFGFSD